MTKVLVTFLDNSGKEHGIPVLLADTDLSKRWVELIERNQKLEDKTLHAMFINYTHQDIFKIQQKLNDVVSKINLEYDRTLPLYQDVNTLNEAVLNDLHEEYEIYGTRVDELIKSEKYVQALHDNFLLLNELIHSCEEVIHGVNMDISPMSTLFDYYPQTEFADILERDKLFLKTDFRWGHVYLGYNTLGKDWLKVYTDNDLDVIKREMVKPQVRFAAETWINFGPDDFFSYATRQFEKWYLGLPAELQEKVPVDNLNKLSLGRFLIGRVLIDQRYFLQYHNVLNDWLVQNHPIKQKWNTEVFSTFQEIKKIEVYYG